MQVISRILATVFYIGYLKPVPGTYASLVGVLIYIALKVHPVMLGIVALVCTLVGFLVSGEAEKLFGKKDPRQVVIDETAGMLLCYVFLPCERLSWIVIAAIFVVFRIFDWVKPFGIRSLQKFPGGIGIMIDDVLAAAYTNLIFQVYLRLTS